MKSDEININPPKGDRTGFIKASITLPPELYEDVIAVTVKRKVTKKVDPSISAVIREALQAYLPQLAKEAIEDQRHSNANR